MFKYIRDHWHGAHSLPRSYWLNTAVPVTITSKIIEPITAPGYDVLTGLFLLVLTVWGMVGTWRSASRSKREGLHGGWPTVTKAVLVINILLFLGIVVQGFEEGYADPALAEPSGSVVQAEPSLYDELTDAASAINERLPMMSDSVTELWNVSAVAPNVMVYHLRLLTVSRAEIDAAAFNAAMEPEITAFVCSTPDMRELLGMGVTVRYSYYDEDRTHIGDIEATESACEAEPAYPPDAATVTAYRL